MSRFALLEHTDAPDDPTGRHFDLLLEADATCRTWRLAEVPVAGGPAVTAVELPPHRSGWLDHRDGPVSGGRGHARRVDSGTFTVVSDLSAESVVVDVVGTTLVGRLLLRAAGGVWRASLS